MEAGKSTLQKSLIGMVRTYQGSAMVNGIECKKRTKHFYENIGVDNEFSTMYENSLSVISLVVATALALAARVNNLYIVLLGTVISSVIFTLFGIIAATKIVSLNQFISAMVSLEEADEKTAVYLFVTPLGKTGYFIKNKRFSL